MTDRRAAEPGHRPAAGTEGSRARISTRAFTIAALSVCVLVACGLSFFASAAPDGLEYVAGAQGFLDAADESATAGSPVADYATAGVAQSWPSVAIAGAIGCLVTFGIAWCVGLVARRRRTR